jgi:hypothetical protein
VRIVDELMLLLVRMEKGVEERKRRCKLPDFKLREVKNEMNECLVPF